MNSSLRTACRFADHGLDSSSGLGNKIRKAHELHMADEQGAKENEQVPDHQEICVHIPWRRAYLKPSFSRHLRVAHTERLRVVIRICEHIRDIANGQSMLALRMER